MEKKYLAQFAAILLVANLPLRALSAEGDSEAAPRWSWQASNAEVDAKGDLGWKPRPFAFQTGNDVRYIDFEKGDDANSGENASAPWKHHPWDRKAAAKAAAGSADTYVFKRGVAYRGELLVKGTGRADRPIRLTSDPGWGRGEAVLCGSERIAHWTKGATHKDIPEPEKVWWADLDFAPRAVWTVGKDGAWRNSQRLRHL
jgi:hypothetical protein